MVKPHHLLLALLGAFILLLLACPANAQQIPIQYHLDYEWAQIWINPNGTIDLLYNMSVTSDSGTISYVNVGQPNDDFTIGIAEDDAGRTLNTAEPGGSIARVYLYTPISSGQTARFSLLTNVAHMIYEDAQNPGNVGMQFIPTWFNARIDDLRVLIVLPSGVTQAEVKTSVFWNNTQYVDSQFAVFWERQNLSPNQQYTFGVSFPAKYVQSYEKLPTGIVLFFQKYGLYLLTTGVTIGLVGAVIYARKHKYLIPKISIETLGIRRGLTAVEASYLLDMKPTMIVTETLYSLLQKRAVWVESATPFKLRIMPQFQNKTDYTLGGVLRYYEIDFLNAIKWDGSLDEEKLAQTVIFLRHTVEEKLRGYCRRDTIDYYRKIVAKAWEQIEQAGTTELASKAYDEQLLWLFLDPNYRTRTQTVFSNTAFEPSPLWLWYWYGYQHYHPHPTYKPNVENPTQAAKPPTIPGADFANNIASAIEKTSNNIVTNVEKFANTILAAPAPSKASSSPAHHGASCVCACAACACACACVSCACACAGGGVG